MDIRNTHLGYTIHSLRYVMGSEVAAIAKVAVNRHPTAPQIDRSLRAIFDMHSDVTSSIYCDLGMPKWGCGPWGRIMPRLPKASITVTGTEGEVCLDNFIAPSLWHSITVKHGGEDKVVKAYTTEGLEGENHGEEWWTTSVSFVFLHLRNDQLFVFFHPGVDIVSNSKHLWIKSEDVNPKHGSTRTIRLRI